MKRCVGLAVDQNPTYEFFAPLTAAVWQRLVGYHPIIICIGLEEHWARSRSSSLVLEKLRSRGAEVSFVQAIEGYRTANMAQVSRMYAFASHSAMPDDYVLTSDVDMWPLAPAWFHENEPTPGAVAVLYANSPSRFPMCYIGAHAGTWKELMLDPFGIPLQNVTELVHRHMRTYLSPQTSAPDAWQHDEEFLTNRIHQLPGYPDRCRLVRRPRGEPFPDRIDRVAWPGTPSLSGKLDAHLLRNGFGQHWPKLRELLGLIDRDLSHWGTSYHDEYVRTRS